MEIFVLSPNPVFSGEHIEHFDPHAKKWIKCKSSRKELCPFTLLPHKLAYEKISCDCGKTMEEFLKRLEEVMNMRIE